ncbi:hypothetical protein OBV_15900 [Oscillibacter valericigenes Sjm18-20]|nr:hypothetical protein OBV_15900 [Oscillibacter valericigenes Sjm18-20]
MLLRWPLDPRGPDKHCLEKRGRDEYLYDTVPPYFCEKCGNYFALWDLEWLGAT